MILDASVARSMAVLGWVEHLKRVMAGSLCIAHGVLAEPEEHSELRGIRDALQREARLSNPGSGRCSKALAASLDITKLLGPPPAITLAFPGEEEVRMAVRLNSPDPCQREWRRALGLTSNSEALPARSLAKRVRRQLVNMEVAMTSAAEQAPRPTWESNPVLAGFAGRHTTVVTWAETPPSAATVG
jgi:hypothetical protein